MIPENPIELKQSVSNVFGHTSSRSTHSTIRKACGRVLPGSKLQKWQGSRCKIGLESDIESLRGLFKPTEREFR